MGTPSIGLSLNRKVAGLDHIC